MEDIPPSYDNINISVLDLLPSYISTATLVNLCRVSKSYYATFSPHLWGSPASHFVPVANRSSRTTNGINFASLQVSGTQNDMVYVALTRFKRILRRARLSTRMLCHTLHLPAALSEIYGGPNSTWLREVLDWLPALQSLCVSGLPFFDHDSLMAVDQSKNFAGASDSNDEGLRSYPIKLLLAAKEPNVTWAGLSVFIPHLPYLVYLDLSYTSPARNASVLRSLHALPDLQILKLRGLGLKDNDLEVLAQTIKLRVRLLDIAENQLSDAAVRSLTQYCVWLPRSPPSNGNTFDHQYSRRHLESWPVGLPPPPDSLSLDTIRTVELDEALLMQLTNPLTGRLAFEDIPHGGITHLYISGNPSITFEGIRSMLDVGRLHVLDAGEIAALTAIDLQVLAARRQSAGEAARARGITTAGKNIRDLINRHKSRPPSVYSTESVLTDEREIEGDIYRLPGAETLLPALKKRASKNLTHLRVNHTFVTSVLDIPRLVNPNDQEDAAFTELPGIESRATELDVAASEVFEAAASKTFATELSSHTSIFEMDATPSSPRVELPGDIIHFAISPPIGSPPQPALNDIKTVIRGEGAMAPEVVQDHHTDKSADSVLVRESTETGVQRTSTSNSSASSTRSPENVSLYSPSTVVVQPAILHLRSRTSTGSEVTATPTTTSSIPYHKEMQELINQRPKFPVDKFHPSLLPNLRTLVLTNLPSQVISTSSLIEYLKNLIIACAYEARLALLQARTNYSLPPGRARQDAELTHARTLFALRTIVLEIDPELEKGPQRGWKHTTKRFDISKSSTGDPDSEALWSAADDDFSFFGEEGEVSAECGIYDQEPEKYYPTITPFNDKIVVEDTHGWGEQGSVWNSQLSSPIAGSYPVHNMSGRRSVVTRNLTTMQSPRNLPLGRNRRPSNEATRQPSSPSASESKSLPRYAAANGYMEMPASIPTMRTSAPTSNPSPAVTQNSVQLIDVVAELAKWRRERKAAYEIEVLRQRTGHPVASSKDLTDSKIFVEGYWSGEVKVIRNAKKNLAKGKMERQGNVDIYGNYFEGGYLYP